LDSVAAVPAAAGGDTLVAEVAAKDTKQAELEKEEEEEDDSMRILCLHGYRQTGSSFRQKTGAFRKLVKKTTNTFRTIRYDFIDAPHLVDSPSAADVDLSGVSNNSGLLCLTGGSAGTERAWWFSKPTGGFNASEQSDWEHGLEESLKLVVAQLRKHAYDGLMGFSQGAAMAYIVLRHLENEEPSLLPKFAILFAPFKSPCSGHNKYYDKRVDTPCMVVSGEVDKVIPREMTEALLPTFGQLSFFGHPAGHIVPAKAEHRTKYLSFINLFDKRPPR
ncbi:hypothetical protein BOX15_Mlig029331g1, partial [Macrostomum lignano]